MMNVDNILKLVRSGDLDIAEAKQQLEELWQGSREDAAARTGSAVPQRVDDTLGYAQLDLDRPARTGFPEVIFGEGKSAEQIAAIFERLMAGADRVLATRVSPDKAAAVLEAVPQAIYRAEARALTWRREDAKANEADGYIAVVCAGTSDMPVAEEAAVTAEVFGCRVERVYDVGVAGIHRLFRRLDVIRGADAIVVAAGMEGALPSVLGGLVASPVVAVPTSVGYGASFQGLAALLSMLNACAPGIAVVNIDNGFGAGYSAALIHKNANKKRSLS
ncbi:nickel pincer cofactor biosynthesis protein LarB [Paenibacillus ginsengihumi]|uniref:nickel pincer cofactor biosynthesis protein LarB n=1 Tax=Paenibacillus ginsengihumi TaxID=431596 RepID=UPI00037CA9EB|nr:nickel pincer cofactor biosynthesis protein LarB [Paenibacillus ginsengihumi]